MNCYVVSAKKVEHTLGVFDQPTQQREVSFWKAGGIVLSEIIFVVLKFLTFGVCKLWQIS